MYSHRLIYESPRWLLVKGRTEEATVVIKVIARTNKTQLSDVQLSRLEDETEYKDKAGAEERIWHVCRSRTLTIRLLILCFGWYVLLYNVPILNMNVVFTIVWLSINIKEKEERNKSIHVIINHPARNRGLLLSCLFTLMHYWANH